jgi:hypothetical protein
VKNASKITDGLKMDRGCTDILCLIIWFAFLGFMGYLTYYGFHNGNINKLLAPINGDGVLCGEASQFKQFKYLYLTDFRVENIDQIFKTGICVNECPSSTKDKLLCEDTKDVVDCDDPKKVHVYDSFQLLNFCIPNVSTLRPETKATWEKAYKAFIGTSAGSHLNDIFLSSTGIWISLALAPVYCFVFVAIMSAFAETIAWLCVILVQVALITATVLAVVFRK